MDTWTFGRSTDLVEDNVVHNVRSCVARLCVGLARANQKYLFILGMDNPFYNCNRIWSCILVFVTQQKIDRIDQ